MNKENIAASDTVLRPQCSIVIPTCNRHEQLLRAIDSALKALQMRGEIIVVDDGTNSAHKVLAQFSDRRLRVCINEGPHGASAARNFGVRQSASKLVLFLDDDDEMIPDYPGRVSEYCRKHPKTGWGFAPSVIRMVTPSGFQDYSERQRISSGLQTKKVPFRRKLVATSSGFWVQKAVFQDVGGFDTLQTVDEDTDLCCRLLAAGYEPFCFKQPGTRVYRGWVPNEGEHGQLTATTLKSQSTECYRRSLENNAKILADYPGAVAYLAARYLRRAAKESDRETPKATLDWLTPWSLRFKMQAYWFAKRSVAKNQHIAQQR